MYVPHLMSEVDGTADLLVKSPDFFELGAKVAYDIDFSGMCLQFNVGVQNIFNSYQKDFDKGATRDSGYIYGPGAPRSYFAGVKLSFSARRVCLVLPFMLPLKKISCISA